MFAPRLQLPTVYIASCQPHFRLPPASCRLAASLRRTRLPKLATPSAASLPGTPTPALLLTPPPPPQLHLYQHQDQRDSQQVGFNSPNYFVSSSNTAYPTTRHPPRRFFLRSSLSTSKLYIWVSSTLALIACHCWTDYHPRFELLFLQLKAAPGNTLSCNYLHAIYFGFSVTDYALRLSTPHLRPHLCLISKHQRKLMLQTLVFLAH